MCLLGKGNTGFEIFAVGFAPDYPAQSRQLGVTGAGMTERHKGRADSRRNPVALLDCSGMSGAPPARASAVSEANHSEGPNVLCTQRHSVPFCFSPFLCALPFGLGRVRRWLAVICESS